MRYLLGLSVCLGLFSASTTFAKEIPVQGRLTAGMTQTDPSDANTVMSAQGLGKFEGVTQLGIEITYPLYSYLDVGMRYTKRMADVEENPASSATDYSAKIDQDAIMLLARVPFYKSEIVRMDAFAGIGGTNTSIKMTSASQVGEYTKRESNDWVAAPYGAAGLSLAIGYKWVYVVFEGGFESNKISGFKKTGSVTSDIETLDLSGSYFTLGLMFDGVPGTVGK